MDIPNSIWMERLLRLATIAGNAGEVPVAAVVLDPNGKAIGWGSNRREGEQNPLAHAELIALRQASHCIDRDLGALSDVCWSTCASTNGASGVRRE